MPKQDPQKIANEMAGQFKLAALYTVTGQRTLFGQENPEGEFMDMYRKIELHSSPEKSSVEYVFPGNKFVLAEINKVDGGAELTVHKDYIGFVDVRALEARAIQKAICSVFALPELDFGNDGEKSLISMATAAKHKPEVFFLPLAMFNHFILDCVAYCQTKESIDNFYVCEEIGETIKNNSYNGESDEFIDNPDFPHDGAGLLSFAALSEMSIRHALRDGEASDLLKLSGRFKFHSGTGWYMEHNFTFEQPTK